jgi:ABC-type multidrug transport system ATPase subunit
VDVIADRVLFIHNGKLVFDGTPETLRENDSLEEPFYRMTSYGRSAESQRAPTPMTAQSSGEE